MAVVDKTRALEERGRAGSHGPGDPGWETRNWSMLIRVAPLVGEGAVVRALQDHDVHIAATPVREEQTVHVEVPGLGIVPSELFGLHTSASAFGSSPEYLAGTRTKDALAALAGAVSVIHQIKPRVADGAGATGVRALEAQLRDTARHPLGEWVDLPPVPEPMLDVPVVAPAV